MKKHLSLALGLAMVLMLSTFLGGAAAAETGKTLTTDFSGPLSSDWRLIGEGAAIEDGVLKATGDFALQPKDAVYDDWALTFDIVKFEKGSAWVGMGFGLKTPDSNFYDSGSYVLLLAETDLALVGAPKLEFANIEEDNGYRFYPDEEQLSKLTEPLNVKYVYQDGTMKLYWKKQSEAASALDTPKATWTNIGNIEGYMKFTTSGVPNYQIDNLTLYNDPSNMTVSSGGNGGSAPAASDEGQSAGSNDNQSVANPDTGDFGVMPFAAIVMAAGAAVLVLSRRLRKN